MVEGSSVPCNFGAEYFDSDHYSNIEIILKDGSRVKANTVILAKNSPYFKELIENKSPKVIEMDEYEAIVCKSFLKSLYSGDPGILDKSNFRQVSKLSFTCEVTWMQQECHAYFRKLLSDSRNNNSHHNKFLLEEAIAAKVYDKDCQYLDALVQQKTQAVSDQDIQAMGMMLNDMKSLPVDHLDFFIRLANKCNRLPANKEYHNTGNDQFLGAWRARTPVKRAIAPRNSYSEALSSSLYPVETAIVPIVPRRRNSITEALSRSQSGFSGNFPTPSQKE